MAYQKRRRYPLVRMLFKTFHDQVGHGVPERRWSAVFMEPFRTFSGQKVFGPKEAAGVGTLNVAETLLGHLNLMAIFCLRLAGPLGRHLDQNLNRYGLMLAQ
jgi:hypothetical protein